MSAAHSLESAGVTALDRLARTLGWRRSLALGAALGGAMGALGLRRRVAEENLARAFPERTAAECSAILAAHYRELGRVALEYPHLPELARAPVGDAFSAVHGLEHLEAVAAAKRGAILMSGHFGNFELGVAWVAQRIPVDVVVRPLSNPRVGAWLESRRRAAGLGLVRADVGVREVFGALRSGRSVAMLADQDARRHGVFVPFLGVPASTPVGPARIAIAMGVPILMAFCTRDADGRHTLVFEPPLFESGTDDDAARRLTARHTDLLSAWVRKRPEAWFWLHRRWKTRPPEAAGTEAAAPPAARAGGA